jgi:hypothetical protein
MPGSPVLALETGLYSKLSTTAALITELGGTAIYNKLAPQGTTPPYVIFQQQGGGDDNFTKTRSRNVLYTVFGVATTAEKAAAIDTDIDTALHLQTLTVTDWVNIWLARETDVQFVELDTAGKATYRCGAIYRIRIEDSS